MSNSTMCYICGSTAECQPYGRAGEWICFTCAFATPEQTAVTEKQLAASGLAKDAARYRLLRTMNNVLGSRVYVAVDLARETTYPDAETVDAAIDAAMQEQSK